MFIKHATHLNTIFIHHKANCCRDSRLVVNEDGLKWVAIEKIIFLILKQLRDIFILKGVGK